MGRNKSHKNLCRKKILKNRNDFQNKLFWQADIMKALGNKKEVQQLIANFQHQASKDKEIYINQELQPKEENKKKREMRVLLRK